jgi:GNAT superfamily N-acetyltransferase
MTDDVRLVRAVSADIERVADLYVAAQRQSGVIGAPGATDDDVTRRWVRKCLIHDEFWIAERGRRELLGIVALSTDRLEILAIDPEQRGQGVGALLLEHAKERRPLSLLARISRDAPDTIDFLTEHGFEPVDGAPDAHGQAYVDLHWATKDASAEEDASTDEATDDYSPA